MDVPVGLEQEGPLAGAARVAGGGVTELTEDPEGEILALRLTQRGEQEMASRVGR